jgi:hypothetical protein
MKVVRSLTSEADIEEILYGELGSSYFWGYPSIIY